VATTATDHHDHPSDWTFIKVALLLGVLTLIEVGTYFESVHQAPDWLIIVALLVLMAAKFYFVVAYFMHLKYDNPIFTKMFSFGLFLAMPIYLVMLFAFGLYDAWGDFGTTVRNLLKAGLIVLPPLIAFFWIGIRRRRSAPAATS
jgi:cytochrome c oxidase subunit 4